MSIGSVIASLGRPVRSGFEARIRGLMADADRIYAEASACYGFECTGCEENCCGERFFHRTLSEYLLLSAGLDDAVRPGVVGRALGFSDRIRMTVADMIVDRFNPRTRSRRSRTYDTGKGISMSIRENAYQVIDLIRPENVLVSVYDKGGLETLVRELLAVNPAVRFYSTGGTGKKIVEVLGQAAGRNYVAVEDYTGAPEMEGGLVKTLHPKIHAGLLAERGNPSHEEYLFRTLAAGGGTPGVYFDIFVGNLYPFSSVVASEGTTSETARVNIDIGGPAMTMASAKNWHSVAVLTRPDQYDGFITTLTANGGMISLRQRFELAVQAMRLVGDYRSAIADHFGRLDFDRDVRPVLKIS
ncbi:MAG: hypothetical protein OHK006_19220 [Thermodesulfovibrionales bacterium]